jgi:small-conductance mechanosensitive channel
MRLAQKIATVVLLGGLGATIYGIVRAGESASAANTNAKRVAQAQLVDRSAFRTARQLAAMADTRDEQKLSEDGLLTSDRELHLAFDIAMREANAHPPDLTEEAKAIHERLQKAEKLQASLQKQVTELTAETAKATGERKEALNDQLSLAKSGLDIATSEMQDAQDDLTEAGANQMGLLQQQRQLHEDKWHRKDAQGNDQFEKDTEKLFPAKAEDRDGLIYRYQQWWALRQKMRLLRAAKAQADEAATAAAEEHEALAAQIDAEKFNSPDLASHSTLAGPQSGTDDAAADSVVSKVRKNRTRDEAREALASTRAIANDQQNMASLDRRADNEKDLADTYTQWIGLVATRQGLVLRRGLTGVAILLAVILAGIFFNTWMEKLLGRLKMDRRQIQTLRAVTRVTLQVLAVLLVLLVILGPPTQLGTFIGLATAGLTVALKDFIVGFIGWFVLMGKNGIRLGDWVEINGVTGEVVETGMFHTVLLETGNWTDSGHPTGRRVTFTNSFAIEGHYFNFSTSGQWLWDELQITIPPGRDPFPLVDAIQKKVLEATQDSTKQAELEWQRAAGSRDVGSISATPSINVRPGGAGIDVQVRYVTRANERYQLRNKLYQSAVELLGGKSMQFSPPDNPDAKPA